MIYIKNPITTSLEDLLCGGWPGHNQNFVETYKDEECTDTQCGRARRSFEDLLEISRTYFPETTEIELAKTLQELGNKYNLIATFCGDINKIVFWRWDTVKSYKNDLFHFIEDSKRNTKGNSPYSANDIQDLIKN